MESGMDPEVKKYFRKIIYSFFFGLLWLCAGSIAGIYFKLAFIARASFVYNLLFYAGLIAALVLLLRYYVKTWKNG